MRYRESVNLEAFIKFSEISQSIEIDTEVATSSPTKAADIGDQVYRVEEILASAPRGMTRNAICQAIKSQVRKQPKATTVQGSPGAQATGHGLAK